MNNLQKFHCEWLPSDFIERGREYRMCDECTEKPSTYDAKQKSEGGRFMYVNWSICEDCYNKIVECHNA